MNMIYLSVAIVLISGTVLVGILGYFLYRKRQQYTRMQQFDAYYEEEPTFMDSKRSLAKTNAFTNPSPKNYNKERGRGNTLDLFQDQIPQPQLPPGLSTAFPSAASVKINQSAPVQNNYFAETSYSENHFDEPHELHESPEPFAEIELPAEQGITQHARTQNEPVEEFIVIYTMAEHNRPFVGYELLQALLSSGLRYGEMNIFHRFERAHGRGNPLFSLASATEPGTFDLNKMGEVSCKGLCLFMNLADVKDPIIAFERMVDTATQLVEDLGGDIHDARGALFDNDRLTDYRERVRDYVITYRSAEEAH